jgi:hypothetical protein
MSLNRQHKTHARGHLPPFPFEILRIGTSCAKFQAPQGAINSVTDGLREPAAINNFFWADSGVGGASDPGDSLRL